MKWILVFSLLGTDLKITDHQIDRGWDTKEACINDSIMIDYTLVNRYGSNLISSRCELQVAPTATGLLPWPAQAPKQGAK